MLKSKAFIAIVLLLILCVAAAYWQVTHIRAFMHQAMNVPGEGVSFEIQKGDTLKKVWYRLHEQALLERRDYPHWYARWYNRGEHIKAGEYFIPSGSTPLKLLERFEQGDVTRYTITLVEGSTFKQVIELLQKNAALSHELTPAQLADFQQLLAVLQVDNPTQSVHPEGLFFPDTYQFVRGDTDISILRRAYVRLQDVLHEEWQKRQPDLPIQTPYQALILASLVEKETGVPSERAKIAGVFVARLRKNMLLQTDPTIIYGLGDGYQGNIRTKHLRDKTNPYNTYQHAGLPPTPIAIVGREAIRAALQPNVSRDLFFVARGDGSHHFSATYAEHKTAVQQYQLVRREDYRSSPASVAGDKLPAASANPLPIATEDSTKANP